MILFLALFLVSGFSSLLYEVVWLRLAMGTFGVTAPFVSIFLSVFMAGLGLGSWGAGRLCKRLESKPAGLALRFYAGAEFLIALSSLTVPYLLRASRDSLANGFGGVAWASSGFYAVSALITVVVLLPWCACMGATFPLAMSAIQKRFKPQSSQSFSYLYLANVVGAGLGTLASAFVLVELLGFRGTLLFGAALNFGVAAAAMAASFSPAMRVARAEAAPPVAESGQHPRALFLLFMSGLVSMAMEVVWTRQFTPYLGNSVYAFALILAAYLLASFAGACLYRSKIGRRAATHDAAWIFSGAISLLPLYAADPYLPLNSYARIAVGVVPLCGLLGFLTPALIDGWSQGNPVRAGTAYMVNIAGCVLGPLVAGFVFLPRMEENRALLLLSLPLFAAGLYAALRPRADSFSVGRAGPVPIFGAAAVISILIACFANSLNDAVSRVNDNVVIRRDYQANVTAGGTGREKVLQVNNIGMTKLTPITKIMAHLPLAFLPRAPRSALVICFGMGTTFRSLVSWGIPSTAVELVPSVPSLFGFFHEDAGAVLASPGARVVIDDGRRFLARTAETYDVITLDPAPPMTAAGTSFLFSEEFYALAKRRLSPDGIMQIWIVEPLEPDVVAAFTKAAMNSFPHVRAFRSLEGWGYHLLASREPIPSYSAGKLAGRLPPAAARDLLDMGPHKTGIKQFQAMLDAEIPVKSLLVPGVEGLRDDAPINEYFFLRRGSRGETPGKGH